MNASQKKWLFHTKIRLALASVLGPLGTFAEIHSTHPGALMHYSRLVVPTPVVNPDSSPPVQSPFHVYRPWENLDTYVIYLSYDCDFSKP